MGFLKNGLTGYFRAVQTTAKDIFSGRMFTDPYASIGHTFSSLAGPFREDAQIRRERKEAAKELHALARDISKTSGFKAKNIKPDDKADLAKEYIIGHDRLLIISQIEKDQYRYKMEKPDYYTDHGGRYVSRDVPVDPDEYPIMAGHRGPTTDAPPINKETLKKALQDFVADENQKKTQHRKHNRRVAFGALLVAGGLTAAYHSGDQPNENDPAPSDLPTHEVVGQQTRVLDPE